MLSGTSDEDRGVTKTRKASGGSVFTAERADAESGKGQGLPVSDSSFFCIFALISSHSQ